MAFGFTSQTYLYFLQPQTFTFLKCNNLVSSLRLKGVIVKIMLVRESLILVCNLLKTFVQFISRIFNKTSKLFLYQNLDVVQGYDTDICPSWDPIINPALFSLPRRPSLNPSQLEDIQCSRIPGVELNSPGYCKLSCSAKSLPLSAFRFVHLYNSRYFSKNITTSKNLANA